jgi:hypothetical protein
MILVVGTRGGIGTTQMAIKLIKNTPSIGLDAWDGQLAARLGRPAVTLIEVALSTRQNHYLDFISSKKMTLLWTEECAAYPDRVRSFLREMNARIEIIADGGVSPPPLLEELAEAVIIVTKDGDNIAAYHERLLKERYKGKRTFTVKAPSEEINVQEVIG